MQHFFKLLTSALIITSLLSCENGAKQQDNSEKKEEKIKQQVAVDEKPQTIERTQTAEERINDIRKWYAEIINQGLSNCKTKTKTSYDSPMPDMEPFAFEQTASSCILSNDFQLIEAYLNGYEWGNKVHIYKKNGKIFFVFIEGGAESWTFEKRYYCDKDENVIRYLEREGENGDQPNGPQTTMKLNADNPNIRAYLNSEFKEIAGILKAEI